MTAPKALVRNAADPKQVRDARDSIEERERERISDLGFVMRDARGRRFYWGKLARCNTYSSIFDGHGSRMSYNSGRQDIGHEWLADVVTHYPAEYLLMQQEAMDRDAKMTEPESLKESDA